MVSIPTINIFDFIIALIIVVLSLGYSIWYKRKYSDIYSTAKWLPYALLVKLLASIAFVLISIFYYKKGDTFLYFQIAEDLRMLLYQKPLDALQLLFTSYSDLADLSYHPLQKYNYFFERSTNWFFGRIVFLFSTIGNGSYLITSLLMALFSFFGLWKGYQSLSKLYYSSSGLMLIPFFCIPTMLLWSSGILRETVIVGLLGLIIWSVINIIKFKEKFLLSISILLFSIFLILLLKPILSIIITPFIGFCFLIFYTQPLNKKNRLFVRVSISLILILIFIVGNQFYFDVDSKYHISNLLVTLEGFHKYHTMEGYSLGGSVYTLGNLEYSWLGIIKKIPVAFEATFLRPYLWEMKNIPMLLATLESMFFIFFFLIVAFKMKRNIRVLYAHKEVLIFITFSVLYGVVVGLSAYNFGALSRYKIPVLMFMYIAIAILYKPNQSFKN